MFAERLGEYSQNMLSEAFWTPNTVSSQFDGYPELGSRSKSSPNKEPAMFAELFLGSTNNTNYIREANVRPVKTIPLRLSSLFKSCGLRTRSCYTFPHNEWNFEKALTAAHLNAGVIVVVTV